MTDPDLRERLRLAEQRRLDYLESLCEQQEGEALRLRYGIDGTMGDAQDVDHPFHASRQGSCVVCGLAQGYRRHLNA